MSQECPRCSELKKKLKQLYEQNKQLKHNLYTAEIENELINGDRNSRKRPKNNYEGEM